MGWMTRFEPATSASTGRRSNQLSYIHHKFVFAAGSLLKVSHLGAESDLCLFILSF